MANITASEAMVAMETSPLSFATPAPFRAGPPLFCRVITTLLFHTFLDSGQFCFQFSNFERLTFGGSFGVLSSTEASLPLWVVTRTTSCMGVQYVSWPWWEPSFCILSVSLLTAAFNFSESSTSSTWVFCRQGFISMML